MKATWKRLLSLILSVSFLMIAHAALGQVTTGSSSSEIPAASAADSEQTARILGLNSMVARLRVLQAQRSCGSIASPEELTIRQELLESIQASVLDVDGVLSEISNESNQLADLRTSLENRRDRTISRLNAASLITGAGLGTAVSATQFSTLGTRTQNIGDGIAVGAGVASIILSIMAVRRQHGPNGTVGDMPNMLAPLLGGAPVLNTYYPPDVRQYLDSVPANEDPKRGSRLEQLRSAWVKVGRLDASDSVQQRQKVAALTTSQSKDVKVSIDDLTDRIAMLADVSGRASLMKRDLAVLMRSYGRSFQDCKSPTAANP
jgi:hypothetical protein